MKNESEMKQASKEAAAMISDAMEDSIFKKFTGVLQVQIEVKENKRICSLYFGGESESSDLEKRGDYYADAENTEKTLAQTYNELLQSLEESERIEQITEDTEDENKKYFDRMERSYDLLYEKKLSEQYTTSEKTYNAKGNFYAILGGDTACLLYTSRCV